MYHAVIITLVMRKLYNVVYTKDIAMNETVLILK